MINQQNCMTAKSDEIYWSPKKTGTLSNQLGNDRNSGPSSLESAEVLLLSDSSNIENEKVSYRTSTNDSTCNRPEKFTKAQQWFGSIY